MPKSIYQSHFKPSKYIDTYFRIMSTPNKEKSSYTEKHHILPKALFPNNAKTKTNLVRLSAREHYIAHMLLYKHFKHTEESVELSKMTYAWHMMAFCSMQKHERSYQSGRKFSLLREIHSDNMKKRRASDETKLKMSIAMTGKSNPMYNYKWTKEQRDAIQLSRGDFTHTEDTKKRMAASHQKRQQYLKDNNIAHHNTGKKASDETRAKMRASALGKILGAQTIAQCPHCDKSGGVSLMKRWHFDNCKTISQN